VRTVDVVEVRPLEGYRLYLKFEDGVEGEVDVRGIVPFEGVSAPLQNPACFAEVRVVADLGTVGWPNGADLDPDVLYAKATGKRIAI